jgi:SAM-dependent methyltransferase
MHQLRPPRNGRVHLGCGDVYLSGYLNIDFPPEQGVASGTSRPDVEADILGLACPERTLAEIRSHHLFEHFARADALALLVRWYGWLRPGGRLVVETPDFEACIAGFGDRSPEQQALILRHLYGSQEARWAVHLDGWSAHRFDHVLGRLGFADLRTARSVSDPGGLLVNVIAQARRPVHDTLLPAGRRNAALGILRESMNGENPTEERLFTRWRMRFEELVGQD